MKSITPTEYKNLDNSVESFKFLKAKSEQFWQNVELNVCWGYQTQEGSVWKTGLSKSQLENFQNEMGFKFSESLKNYFGVMNGLDKPGLNNNNNESEIDYRSMFYSYPDDIQLIKDTAQWIFETNQVARGRALAPNIPNIFPYHAHRCLVLDNEERILSMYGSDIIHWADNLSQGLARDIFGYSQPNRRRAQQTPNGFWYDLVQ